ncbi:hypothetical protein S7711_11025 [Stachybotrys chartarum IBT 7711]|uniref:Uncharacterized protein n=1 Tax=Stachybotrys chartarum (strain CBS 109288 / IBT 7711) TaxID=1280523 RepID=A0A084B4X9_STACB|nr:hypothetical protein S7711_11025 [Stachybotrys chartarum IBT 7711]KFA79113.1 hypothetical protein S40288_11693 [Stachybotrys chartarum IBT 40288]
MAQICLDVAIDHRIKRLFRSVPTYNVGKSDHVNVIASRGVHLGLDHHEVRVTKQLAGPATKGGIAIVLQQPRDNHPFSEGLDAVVEDCQTLSALSSMFKIASRGTLDMSTDITIIDLLSYLPNPVNGIDDAALSEAFQAATEMICKKEPHVVLCAGKIWLPRANKFDDRKGDAFKLESIGLGKKFGVSDKLSVTTRLRSGPHQWVSVNRVNGFHPSHAINHRSHVSLLRQLQLLIAAETCRRCRGDWEEQAWMDDLRERCQQLSSGSKNCEFIAEFSSVYSDTLKEIESQQDALVSRLKLGRESSGTRYKALLKSGLSRLLNDASLALVQMARFKSKSRARSMFEKNTKALEQASSDTANFLLGIHMWEEEQDGWEKLASLFGQLEGSLETCVHWKSAPVAHLADPEDKESYEYPELEFERASKVFLDAAVSVESLLEKLLSDKELTLQTLGQEEYLSSMMGRMNLAPPTVFVQPIPQVSEPYSYNTSRPTKRLGLSRLFGRR